MCVGSRCEEARCCEGRRRCWELRSVAAGGQTAGIVLYIRNYIVVACAHIYKVRPDVAYVGALHVATNHHSAPEGSALYDRRCLGHCKSWCNAQVMRSVCAWDRPGHSRFVVVKKHSDHYITRQPTLAGKAPGARVLTNARFS